MKFKKTLLTSLAFGFAFTQFPLNSVQATYETPFFQYKGDTLQINQVAQYDSQVGEGGTEILAYDELRKKAFVTNGTDEALDILSFESLKSGEFQEITTSKRIYLKDFGISNVDDITSVASHPTENLIALSVVSVPKTDQGYILFLTKDGDYITKAEVGSLPDMVTFSPDGKKAIVANEGEPSDDYLVDPEGTVSIIDIEKDMKEDMSLTVRTLSFTEDMLDDEVRVSSKGSVLQQLEPEYVSVTPNSKTAYVSLQENNAIATIDLEKEEITSVKGLGVKDHSVAGNELDGKRDGEITIEKLPLLGFYMPDAIETFQVGDKTYILTPNEGDARDYDGYSEEASIKDISDNIQLNADNYEGYSQAELDQLVEEGLLDTLSKTKITLEDGLVEGKYEALYSYGARSFSIFDAETMELVFDSGSDFEKLIADALPTYFNTTNDEIDFDKRSSAKGPEPETVVTGRIEGVTYAFIALERMSGIMVYDLSNPKQPTFVTFISSRDFTEDVKGDVSPEGLRFITAENSPTGHATLAATHEVSGTVAVYEFKGIPSYTDVDESFWAYDYIHDLTRQGIVTGKEDMSFAPHESVTRGQFAIMISRALGLEATSPNYQFSDVGEWARDEVQAAYDANITKGRSSGLFSPNDPLTREQMATIVVRAIEHKTGTKVVVEGENEYKDKDKIDDYAVNAVQTLYQLSIMEGSKGYFLPKHTASRAESAKVLSLLLQEIK
ncbi:choice-of-anchor I family protein [Bacillus solitudinis]|uniref:choice-of-anchor I family protein n=1 Tax=Bacillus solitudinis TaxID=2014074 RepID=UPI000C2450ED|nr:choice-of-anchor I family protein [Bacillus solitudinis]